MMNMAVTSKTSMYFVCLQITQNIHSKLCSYLVCTMYVLVLNIVMYDAKIAILHQTADNLTAAHTHNIHMTSRGKLLCPMMNKKLQGVSFLRIVEDI